MARYDPLLEIAKAVRKNVLDDICILNADGAYIRFKDTATPNQMKALTTKKRHVAMTGGIQGGKTTCGCVFLSAEIEKYPRDDFMVVAPTVKRMDQSTKKRFDEVFKPQKIGYHKRNESLFKLHSGGNVYFRTVEEDADAVEGSTLRAVLVDEPGDMVEKVWTNLRGRTDAKRGRIFFASAQYDANWFMRLCFPEQFGLEPRPDIEIIRADSVDNPSFPRESWEEAARDLTPEDFNRRYRGIMNRYEGLVYELSPDHLVSSSILPDRPEDILSHFTQIILGVDWGYKHPAAVLVCGVTPDLELWVLDEFYQSEVQPQDMINQVNYMAGVWKAQVKYCCHSRPEMTAAVNGVPNAFLDVVEGVTKVRTRLHQKRIKIVQEKCPNLINEFKAYHYKKSVDSYTQELPEDKLNDALDALRYVIMNHYIPDERPKPAEAPLPFGFAPRMRELDEEDEFMEAMMTDGVMEMGGLGL